MEGFIKEYSVRERMTAQKENDHSAKAKHKQEDCANNKNRKKVNLFPIFSKMLWLQIIHDYFDYHKPSKHISLEYDSGK